MVAASISKHVIDERERPIAAEVAELLGHLPPHRKTKIVIDSAAGTQAVEISQDLEAVFREVCELIQTATKEISLIADDPELSPEEASEILGVSRPMVVQRIKLGDLIARKVGTHHRIRVSDLLAFRLREVQRNAALAEFGETTDQLASKHDR
ncbi:MAG: helix-turn-helix domain-containing protein [Afipia felis]|nr:helix-turn-helix domain-containing protein [Afipia felis]